MITYSALYTKQLTQKNKKYLDGFIKANKSNHKIILCDENGSHIESKFFRNQNIEQLEEEELKFDHYLVVVEAKADAQSSAASKQNSKASASTNTGDEERFILKTNKKKKRFKPPISDTTLFELPSSSSSSSSSSEIGKIDPTARIRNIDYGKPMTQHISTNLDNHNGSHHSEHHLYSAPSNRMQNRNNIPNDLRRERFLKEGEENHDMKYKSRQPYEYKENKVYELVKTKDEKFDLFDDEDMDEFEQELNHIKSHSYSAESYTPPPDVNAYDAQSNNQSFLDDRQNKRIKVATNEKLQKGSFANKFESRKPVQVGTPKVLELIDTSNIKLDLTDKDSDDDEESSAISIVRKPSVKTKPDIEHSQIMLPRRNTAIVKNQVKKRMQESYKKQSIPLKNKSISRNTTSPNMKVNPDGSLPNVLSMVRIATGTQHNVWFPDMKACEMYLANSQHPMRDVHIPDSFGEVDHYKRTFLDAVYEEINLQMFNLALRYRKLHMAISKSKGEDSQDDLTPSCPVHGKSTVILRFSKKENENRNRPFYLCTKKSSGECNFFKWADNISAQQVATSAVGRLKSIENPKERKKFFKENAIPFYSECELIELKHQSNDFLKKKNSSNLYLRLKDKEPSSVYSIDDVWIISSSDEFDPSAGNVAICKSNYHGPDSDLKIQVSMLWGKKFEQGKQLFAIRGPNFSSEFSMIENLEDIDYVNFPLLYDLLGGSSNNRNIKKRSGDEINFGIGLDSNTIEQILQDHIKKFQLNEDQQIVLRDCAKWFDQSRKDDTSPIMLVHGVFGAGKSFNLVVLIMFISALLEEAKNDDIRILVASVTNVAVDNILHGLLKQQFTNFIRVGSQKKISKPILPYTVSNEKDPLKDLQEMLNEENISAEDYRDVQNAIKKIQSGEADEIQSSIGSARVVGVTLAATSFEVLKRMVFPILILDESSQCLEPLGLLPLTRFSCQKLIAVGDPQQLPPTLVGSSGKDDSLEKTMFVRLNNSGHKAITLRTQYRCHPKISELSNRMFYNNILMDGIDHEDRPPLVPNLPPVMVIDCSFGSEKVFRGSFYNEQEIEVIVSAIRMLVKSNIPLEKMGVITLYRQQALKLAESLRAHNLKGIKVSTVDAFQGGERDIIFLSTVRTSFSQGFIESTKRLNVALTRARNHLIIVCKRKTVCQSSLWNTVVNHSIDMNGFYQASKFLTCTDFSFLEQVKLNNLQISNIPPKIVHPQKKDEETFIKLPPKRKREISPFETNLRAVKQNNNQDKMPKPYPLAKRRKGPVSEFSEEKHAHGYDQFDDNPEDYLDEQQLSMIDSIQNTSPSNGPGEKISGTITSPEISTTMEQKNTNVQTGSTHFIGQDTEVQSHHPINIGDKHSTADAIEFPDVVDQEADPYEF